MLAERLSFFVVDRPADIGGGCKWTGLGSLWGDVAWLICFSVSVSAERSTVWILSNSFCSDGGPDPTVHFATREETKHCICIWLWFIWVRVNAYLNWYHFHLDYISFLCQAFVMSQARQTHMKQVPMIGTSDEVLIDSVLSVLNGSNSTENVLSPWEVWFAPYNRHAFWIARYNVHEVWHIPVD